MYSRSVCLPRKEVIGVSVSGKVKALLSLRGKKIMELAEYLGMTQQAMRNKLNRGSFSAEDLIKISVFLDAGLYFQVTERQRIVLDEGDIREQV